MKKTLILSLLCLAAGIAAAQNHHVVSQSQARMLETKMQAVTAPIIAELGEISATKITDTVSFAIGHIKDVNTVVAMLPELKQYAVAQYCAANGYDVIVNALFQVSTNPAGDQLLVVLTGYPAKYKNFRPATRDDTWMVLFTGEGDNNDNINKILNAK
ncbi:MAG: hypothetical protein IK010_07780 [Bacteroidales bacterium]|nr:hypothetical protein [Bacteroidales bacterium]